MKIVRTLLLLAGLGAVSACASPQQVAATANDVPAEIRVSAAADPVPAAEPPAFTVHFAFAKADISASAMQILWEAGHAAEGSGAIRVSGYADAKGSAAYNERLSRRRAEAVAAQLVKIGLAPTRIVVDGRGRRSGGGDAADDRRVEVVFTTEAAADAPVTAAADAPATATPAEAVSSLSVAAPPLAAVEDETAEAEAERDQANDPFETINRPIFAFNHAIDSALFKPIAEGYRDAVPEDGRNRVHDFLENLRSPLRFANDLAQGDFTRAGQTLLRFILNTGVGLGGLVDVAAASGIPGHQTDTGATFGVWGIGEGPYLVLPILGPSNPRDLVGMAADFELDPLAWRLGQFDGYRWVTDTRIVLGGLDTRERNIETLNDIERNSIDLYSAVRSLYRQHREAEIKHSPDIDKLPSPGFSSLPAGTELAEDTH